MTRAALPPLHLLLALAVVAVWGTNFVVIKWGLEDFPPLTFAALRFMFAVLPAVFFLKRPAVPWWNLALYGVFIGVGQFGMLYMAMLLTGERVKPYQLVALGLAAAGLGWLISHVSAELTLVGLGLVLIAAMSWAGGNTAQRSAGQVNMLAYVVWASVFSAPPLFALALISEGWPAMSQAVTHASPAAWAAVLWQSVGNTIFGYTAWGWLLAQHPTATVAPLALMVPVFGMGASAILLGEALTPWKLGAAALVLAGLALNTLWPRFAGRQAAP